MRTCVIYSCLAVMLLILYYITLVIYSLLGLWYAAAFSVFEAIKTSVACIFYLKPIPRDWSNNQSIKYMIKCNVKVCGIVNRAATLKQTADGGQEVRPYAHEDAVLDPTLVVEASSKETSQ